MCAPIVTKPVTGAPAPWLGGKAMKNQDELRRQLTVDTNNIELRERYRTAKTYVKTLISRSKAAHYQGRLHDCKGNTSAV